MTGTIVPIAAPLDIDNPKTVPEWSARIRVSMAATVETIIHTGTVLTDCKAALQHGQFREALEGAGISPRIAQMFMAIANHPVLANTKSFSQLPSSYTVLYQLSRLEPPELAQALEDEAITPKLKVNEAYQLANMAKNARSREGAHDAAAEFADLLEHDAVVANLREEAKQKVALEDSVPAQTFNEPRTYDGGEEWPEWTFADFIDRPNDQETPRRDEMTPGEKVRSDVYNIAQELNGLPWLSDSVWPSSWLSEIPEAERKEMADYLRAELTQAAERVETMLRILEAP